MAGQEARLYVREVAPADVGAGRPSTGVVLFVHGAGTPAEVSFDVPYKAARRAMWHGTPARWSG